MGRSSIDLNRGVSGFVQSMQDLKSRGIDSCVKIHATKTVRDGQTTYHTYSSTNAKGFWPGSKARRQKKADDAMAALTAFVKDMARKHNFSESDRTTAYAMVASVFRDPDNAVKNLNKLASHLEDCAGTVPWRTNMRANDATNQTEMEFHQISQGIRNGQKGLLNPRSDFAKSMKTNVMPEAPAAAKRPFKVLNLEEELGAK